ncbi:MAG TPA: hypothetical protein VG936_08855 [Lacunisphaera sp.]|nr:hypothetical protein [Lacunisphaera sp.]
MQNHAPHREHPLLIVAKRHARALALAAAFVVTAAHAHAQGCVAIKQMGDGSSSLDGLTGPEVGKWDFSASYEYFRSHRHFIGTDEQEQRYTAGSEVVNIVQQMNLALDYRFNTRASLEIGVPYFHATRSSLYEHDRVHRHTMRSDGIGDVRIGGTYWVINPISEPRGNLSVGFGLKLPTGNTNVKDIAYKTTGPVLQSVDQSIQPGDGGWGFTVSLEGYRRLRDTTSLYATGFYLINPRETNGTQRSANVASITAFDSVPDQYQVRLGVSQVLMPRYHLTASLGGRLEGVPALDLIGGSRGFRRPGVVGSIEPGISFATGKDSFALSIPVALYRDRTRSYADMQNGGHGDAAFADFLVNLTYGHRW